MKHIIIWLCCLVAHLNVSAEQLTCRETIALSGDDWYIATDSLNSGRDNRWYEAPPVNQTQTTKVPWVIQDIFNDYHGVAWYWRSFGTPFNRHEGGRCLLKFHSIDYMGEVWLNGRFVGKHEGIGIPCEFDVTDFLAKGKTNLLVVRVLNPTYEPIESISLKDTPCNLKQYPYYSNAVYNSGGITGDVELVLVPPVRIEDIYIQADWKTGKVLANTRLYGAVPKKKKVPLLLKLWDMRTRQTIASQHIDVMVDAGENLVETELSMPHHQLWSPNNPALYQVSASIRMNNSEDEKAYKFGFRDFRYKDGYFKLNGKRIFLKGSNFSTHFPIGYTVPLSEDMLRLDVVRMKAFGFNFVRIPFGCGNPRVLDIYDELGIMVHQEHYGSWQMGDYGGYVFPRAPNNDELLCNRFEKSIKETIIRDRNHPSVIMWGILNECYDGAIFRNAVKLLPELRAIDPGRIFVLNSGRFDNHKEIGSLSNPGSEEWDVPYDALYDYHPYVWMPYSKETLELLSGKKAGQGTKYFITETGLCFPINLPSEIGDFQLYGNGNSDDAAYFKRQYNKFMTDWKKFNLSDCWTTPDEYISEAYKLADKLRETAETVIRSNPYLISYVPTNSVADYSMGESVATNFRRIKPELIGSLMLSNSSLRWCLSTEPQSIYRGDSIELSISISNLDELPAGNYPATLQVFDGDKKPVYEKQFSVTIPSVGDGQDVPFAFEVLREKIRIHSPAGKYTFTAKLDSGVYLAGNVTDFFVSERERDPILHNNLVLCGRDSIVESWLASRNIKPEQIEDTKEEQQKIILMVGDQPSDSLTMLSVAKRLTSGSIVIYTSPKTFKTDESSTRWLPLAQKGIIEDMDVVGGYYRADRWSKAHPIFNGLPSGGMMDYKFYRHVLVPYALSQEYNVQSKRMHTWDEVSEPLDYPDETVCGATRISHTYCLGVHLGIWKFGEGKFIVNTLNIADHLSKDPAADKLFQNMLGFADSLIKSQQASLPSNFTEMLQDIDFIRK